MFSDKNEVKELFHPLCFFPGKIKSIVTVVVNLHVFPSDQWRRKSIVCILMKFGLSWTDRIHIRHKTVKLSQKYDPISLVMKSFGKRLSWNIFLQYFDLSCVFTIRFNFLDKFKHFRYSIVKGSRNSNVYVKHTAIYRLR